MNKTLVSGITATGKLTIGNYLGAIKNFVKLVQKYNAYIFVADLHALTIDIDPQTLINNKKSIYALYLAAGLDYKKATIFFQSDVPEHTYMNWIMESRTTIGELERMTQFKDKSLKSQQNNGTIKIKTNLLTYPALMSGDILLYNADVVPVGIDQKQHLELTRNIAQRFNNQYGTTFNIPQGYFPHVGSKIMSLVDPTKKMSKSDSNQKASIFLLDDPEIAYNKIQKAKTDSENKVYASSKKPGITNLLNTYAGIMNISILEAEQQFQNKNYGEFKKSVGQVVKTFLIDIQEKYNQELLNVKKLSKLGAHKARIKAQETLQKVKNKIGL